jgi:hypothetical protein
VTKVVSNGRAKALCAMIGKIAPRSGKMLLEGNTPDDDIAVTWNGKCATERRLFAGRTWAAICMVQEADMP